MRVPTHDDLRHPVRYATRLITRKRLIFFASAAGVFTVLLLLSLRVPGYLENALLYHAKRHDHRVNMALFSIPWTISTIPWLQKAIGLLQVFMMVTAGIVPLACATTPLERALGLGKAFVLIPLFFFMFNSVCTV